MRNEDVSERVRDLVAPSLEAGDLELFDVEVAGNILRVTVDRPGGVDLDAISAATQQISAVLDRHDDLLPGRYLLEVSSPGIERPLRRPEHFERAVGTTVSVKTRPGVDGDRRVEGVLEAAGDTGIVVAGRSIAYADIERARTVFVWPEPTRLRAGTQSRLRAGTQSRLRAGTQSRLRAGTQSRLRAGTQSQRKAGARR